MKALVTLALAASLLTGCSSLIPKRVEIGQDRVEKFPEPKGKEKEILRQAAERAAEKAKDTLNAALTNGNAEEVVSPAKDTVVLTDAVKRSLGPPLDPAPKDQAAEVLARRLDEAVAKLNRRLDEFKAANDANEGKKIEGTGFLQVPYFIWLGGALLLGFVGLIVISVLWTFLKIYALSNPPLALGLNAVSAGGKVASGAVSQLISGGQKFKRWLGSEVPELTADTQAKILDLFNSAHKESQDQLTRRVVDELTK